MCGTHLYRLIDWITKYRIILELCSGRRGCARAGSNWYILGHCVIQAIDEESLCISPISVEYGFSKSTYRRVLDCDRGFRFKSASRGSVELGASARQVRLVGSKARETDALTHNPDP